MRRLPKPLQNKYYLTAFAFFFILVFLDKNSLYAQWRLFLSVNRLEKDRVYYEGKIKEARVEAEDFDATKERYARENYFMKKANEDVFVIKQGQ